ncbi:hypothetical protein ABMY26_08950 [Azospirillum sp. HJ39]|uniref:hypothetical protein n=1 Tax=Azospirillum sp. HJ39 TaxID=3159496 RepID=UPI003556F68B
MRPLSGSALALIMSAAAALPGCTSLVSQPLSESPTVPAEGFVYYLAKGGVLAQVTRKLASCAPVQIETTATVKPLVLADATEPHLIRYEDLNAITKITDIELTNGSNYILRSVNASVEDRTGAIIENTAKTVVSVVKLAAGLAADGTATPPKPTQCTADTSSALDQYKASRRKSQGLSRSISGLEEAQGTRQQQLAVLRGTAADPARDTAQSIATGIGNLEKLRAELAAELKKQAGLEKALSFSQTYQWLPTANQTRASFPASRQLFTAWFGSADVQSDDFFVTLELLEPVQPAVATVRDAPATPGAGPNPEPVRGRGLIYRQPAPNYLRACVGRPSCAGVGDDSVLLAETVSIPQHGTKAVLPLKNGLFDNNSIKATFDEVGGLLTLTFKAKSSLEAASGSLAAGTETLSGLPAARQDARSAAIEAKTKLTKAEIERVKAETDLQKARRDLKDEMAKPTE